MKKRGKLLSGFLAAALLLTMLSLSVFAVNGTTKDEWLDPYNTVSEVTGGIRTFANVTYKTALNPSYLSFDLNIEKFNDQTDCWITMAFINKNVEIGHGESGLYLLMRKNGENLSIFGGKTLGDNSIVNKVFAAKALESNNIKLFKDGDVYKFTVGSETVALTGLADADFTTDGKTYLAFSAFDAAGDAPNNRVWTVKNISNVQPPKIVENWLDPYNTVTKVDGGVSMFANATYQTALDPSYISYDVDFQKFNKDIDCWITMGFFKAPVEINLGAQNPDGIYFLMRNSGGKLNIQAFKVLGGADVFHKSFTANAIGNVNFKLFKDGSVYKLSVGSETETLTGLTDADFTTDGKTYLAFAAYDAASDAPNNRVWSVKNISNTKPADPVSTPDSQQTSETSSASAAQKSDGILLSNWEDPFNTGKQYDNYFTVFAHSAYKKALKSDYIKTTIYFEKLAEVSGVEDWKAYTHFSLSKLEGVPSVDFTKLPDNLAGLSLIFRNYNGKLLVDVNGYGKGIVAEGNATTFVRKQTNISALNAKITVELKYIVSSSSWDVYINGTKINEPGKVKVAKSFVSSDGIHTYASFLANSSGDAPNERLWRVYELTDSISTGNTGTGNNVNNSNTGDEIFIVFTLISLAFAAGFGIMKYRKA